MGTRNQGNITNTETTTIDESNINVGDVEENAVVLGSISGGDDVEINITDGGIARDAFDFARDVSDNNRSVIADTLEFAGDTVDANRRITGAALAFGQEALDFGRDALSDTFDFADKESARYVRLANESQERAQDAFRRANEQASNASAQAISSVRAEANASRSAILDESQANRSALLRTFDGSFDAIRSGFGSALSAVAGSVDKVTRAVTGTIETATNATRSETAQGFDTLIKYGALAAAGIAVAFIISR